MGTLYQVRRTTGTVLGGTLYMTNRRDELSGATGWALAGDGYRDRMGLRLLTPNLSANIPGKQTGRYRCGTGTTGFAPYRLQNTAFLRSPCTAHCAELSFQARRCYLLHSHAFLSTTRILGRYLRFAPCDRYHRSILGGTKYCGLGICSLFVAYTVRYFLFCVRYRSCGRFLGTCIISTSNLSSHYSFYHFV